MVAVSPESASSNRSHRIALALAIAVVALSMAARIIPGARTIDDAYITFRYSRNIVEGIGFVYNPGVQTLGTTTPLFTLLMAAISGLTGSRDFPNLALVVSALADAGSVFLLYLTMRRFTGSSWLGLMPAGLWALAPYSVTFAIGGMETSLAVLWLVAATWVYASADGERTSRTDRSDSLLGVLVALGLLTRIDSALWALPLLVWQALESLRIKNGAAWWRRLPWSTWIACGFVLLPWVIFSAAYFGSPLPNSLAAKTVAYVMPDESAVIRLMQHYALPFNESDVFTPAALALGVVYAALTLIAALAAWRQIPRLVPFLIFPWIYFAAFALANPLIFRWYLTPPLPGLIFGIIAGVWVFTQPLAQTRLRFAVPAVFVSLGIWWLISTLGAWRMHPDHGADRPAPHMAWNLIELMYEDIGTRLREEYGVTPETRVASADIGAIGYFSRGMIIDTVGLVTPELSRYYPVNRDLIPPGQNYAIPPQLIHDTDPAYLVTMEAFVRLGLERDSDFRARYRLLIELPTDFYGTGMRLYGRSP